MAGTVTVSYQDHRPIKRVIWNWLSDASGNANGTLTKAVSGQVLKVVTNPDGSAAPSDNYDAVINDEDGVDVCGGALGNRDTANSEQVVPVLETTVGSATYGNRSCFDGTLELQISNAGNAKAGVVTLYYQ